MKVSQGIDLVKISRVREVIEDRGKKFLDGVFSPSEQGYCSSKRMRFEHYAARLAAKEAVLKALRLRLKKRPALRGIEVRHEPTGKPYIVLSPAFRKAAGLRSGDQIELSLAHEREYAVASVTVVKTDDSKKRGSA